MTIEASGSGTGMNPLTVIKVVGAFIAFQVGSGFATGQEVLQFFAVEGLSGLLGSGIFIVLCSYVATSLFLSGQRQGFRNSEEVFIYYGGPVFGRLFTWYTLAVIYCVFCLMLAGGGAVLHEQLGLPGWVGSGLLALAVLLTLYFGLRELLNVIGFVGPLLIALIIAVCTFVIVNDPKAIAIGSSSARELTLYRASDSWWWSGLLYAALQVVGMFSFLPAVGATMHNRGEAIAAGILGPLLYFLTLVLVILALLVRMPHLQGKMIPMLDLANASLPWVGQLFAFIILAGIFTTLAPLLWIVLVKFTRDGSRAYRALSVVLTVGGFMASMFMPFDRFMNFIYPTVGYSGILLILMMLAHQLSQRSRKL